MCSNNGNSNIESKMNKIFKNKTILITGGTGSFGQKFVAYLLKNTNIKKIKIFSRDEQKQFQMQKTFKSNKLRFLIGDVRDYGRLNFAMKDTDFVIHAAALKHVEIAEYNPFEVVKTNIFGAQNVIDAAIENKVQKVIALSTDKASSPINLYGATKLTSDKLFISANNFKGNNKIRFSVVRYGNVMGSRGSVLPILLQQKRKNIFTITDKKMTRFNITLEEGINFVIFSLNKMLGGEIFVPKIKSYRITDVVLALSNNPKFKIIGIRSGEKLHEEMISSTDSINSVELKKCYVILPNSKYNKLTKRYYKKVYKDCKFIKKNFTYNSLENNFLTILDIKKLIKKNNKDFEKLSN